MTAVLTRPDEVEVEVASIPVAAIRPLRARALVPDIVEEWGKQSFPASDPPANW